MSAEHASEDRKLSLRRLPLYFCEIWLATTRRKETVRESTWKLLARRTEMLLPPWVWPMMTIRKRRRGVRLSEDIGEAEYFFSLEDFGRICRCFGRIWIGRVRCSGGFQGNSIYFKRDVNADSDRFQRVVRRRENFETSLDSRDGRRARLTSPGPSLD